jgi:hypothetical protein
MAYLFGGLRIGEDYDIHSLTHFLKCQGILTFMACYCNFLWCFLVVD